jgi:hypothetical protein
VKVYKSYNGCKAFPEIKIKNKKLAESGFRTGAEYSIIYKRKKIILMIYDKMNSECHDHKN